MKQNYLSGARWVAFGIVVLVGAPVLVGCGSTTAKVTGKVTFKGDPLPAGTITFYGKEGTEPSQGTIDDGNYTVQAAPIGDCTVTVTVPQGQSAGQSGMGGQMAGVGLMPGSEKQTLKGGKDLKEGSEKYKDQEEESKMSELKKKSGGKDPMAMANKKSVKIGAIYNTKERSPLKYTIKKGTNANVNFDLTE